MAQPKSKISRARSKSRRAQNIRIEPNFPAVCPTTKEFHVPHRALKASDGAVYFKGKLIQAAKES